MSWRPGCTGEACSSETDASNIHQVSANQCRCTTLMACFFFVVATRMGPVWRTWPSGARRLVSSQHTGPMATTFISHKVWQDLSSVSFHRKHTVFSWQATTSPSGVLTSRAAEEALLLAASDVHCRN